jgi:hypothetical protein
LFTALLSVVILAPVLILSLEQITFKKEGESYISRKGEKRAFTLSVAGKSGPLCMSSQDYRGVSRFLRHLQEDISNVTNAGPKLSIDSIPTSKEVVIVSTLDKNSVIDKLV